MAHPFIYFDADVYLLNYLHTYLPVYEFVCPFVRFCVCLCSSHELVLSSSWSLEAFILACRKVD